MQHHKPESQAETNGSLCTKSRSLWGHVYNQHLAISVVMSKLGLIVHHYNPECPVANGITTFKVKVTMKVQNVSECLSGWYFLNHSTFCYQVWYSDAAAWSRIMQKLFYCCCYLQGQGHREGSYDQNLTFCYINWTVDSLATKLGLMIHRQKPEYPVKQMGLLRSGSRSQQRVKMLMFVQIISS